jgi:hypothetical protein
LTVVGLAFHALEAVLMVVGLAFHEFEAGLILFVCI